MTKLGLVLSGGGAKGAYQIGAYRALRKIGKNPEIVTGTSVGAINGLLIVQGDLYKAVKLWKNMTFSKIYDEDSFEKCSNDNLKDIYKEYVKRFISEGGMDVVKLFEMIKKLYNSNKLFNSPIDYGLVTYNYSKNKPLLLTKQDMTVDNVNDYVIASASCYPAFKPYEIDGELYIDGGYYDNLPINLAAEMGADEIIAIDLKAVGFKRKVVYDVPITVIAPRNKVTNFLVFDKAKSREALRFGYNDVMKTFGKLDGDKFTFKKGNVVKNYNRYGQKFEVHLNEILDSLDNSIVNKITQSSLFLIFKDRKLTYRSFNKLVEKAGECFGFSEDIIYNIRTYNKGLFNELSRVSSMSIDNLLNKIRSRNFSNIIDKREIVRFFYNEIRTESYDNVVKFLPMFFDDFLIALYITLLKVEKNLTNFLV